MVHEKIQLYSGRENVFMMTYIAGYSKEMPAEPKKCVLVLPGGGYQFTSDREAEPIAKAFFAANMNACVLRYSVGADAANYNPLADACRAMQIIRENAAAWNINPNQIVVCGFSAGGHLAASIGTLWHLDLLSERLGCSNDLFKPNGMILSYAVITANDKAHRGSINSLCGKPNPTEEEANRFSLEKHVDERTCPAFLWHTATDNAVPVENCLYMSEALAAKKIPFEVHIFPTGGHGLSLATPEVSGNAGGIMPYVARWIEFAIKWINESLFA